MKEFNELPQPIPYVTASPRTTADLPKTEKVLVYGGATIFAVCTIICGVFTCISLSNVLASIFGGIILIISGLLIMALEVPILCTCVRFIEPIAKFSQARAPWQKMIFYAIPPIPVLAITQGISAIFGSIFIWGVAFIYFYIFIRRRK